ncbi:serpin I2 [Pseudophryne corroboree]|uniref:serpin I2 n=1 Tax=Pseudophryne corroboree TaxID=495146 RepID=UPI0030818263
MPTVGQIKHAIPVPTARQRHLLFSSGELLSCSKISGPRRVLGDCITMRRPFILLFVLSLAGVSITSTAPRLWGDTITEFAVDLHRAIRSFDTEENIIFSPLGATLILGMIKLGAKGTTSHQIKDVLKLQGNQESEEFVRLRKLLAVISEENKEFTFNLANALYLQEGFHVKEQYLHSNRDFFKSEIKLVNFQDLKASAEIISAWVETQTNGKIRNMFTSGDFGPLIRLVLVNAIYFKGEWKHKFSSEATYSQDFTVKRGITTKIPMMHLHLATKLGYFGENNLKYKVLELPYKGDKLSLVIALPAENVEIEDFEKTLTAPILKGWETKMTEEMVEISLPRFKIEHKVDLKRSLLHLNVTDVFNQNCNLSGITDTSNIYISKVVQKVSIEVNEAGSEASASTGMQVAAMSLANHRFIADRPFVFFIRHNLSGSILFMGKVKNPDLSDARGRDVESL